MTYFLRAFAAFSVACLITGLIIIIAGWVITAALSKDHPRPPEPVWQYVGFMKGTDHEQEFNPDLYFEPARCPFGLRDSQSIE